ncbi:hypothetical protein [Limnobaculum xujianqingii]|uniref:hypothetical protein n=1 Tax=Limnobaculum xujianqingii TaxID=2738837 RepID=UPI001129A2F6|nr:hypothetical protein [Limnobaculum xujianqingii]
MNIIDWPDICPSSLTWQLESNSKSFRSPFNGTTQTVRYPGSRWRCSLTVNNLRDDDARKIDALIAALDGEYGRVRLRDYGRGGRVANGSPVVAVNGQTGGHLITSGWVPSMLVLKIGDYITVNDELKIITEDISSSVTGNAELVFSPVLRTSPPMGFKIETQNPSGIFKLRDNNQGVSNRVPGVFSSYVIEFEEAF